jgi:hypothetical protein
LDLLVKGMKAYRYAIQLNRELASSHYDLGQNLWKQYLLKKFKLNDLTYKQVLLFDC